MENWVQEITRIEKEMYAEIKKEYPNYQKNIDAFKELQENQQEKEAVYLDSILETLKLNQAYLVLFIYHKLAFYKKLSLIGIKSIENKEIIKEIAEHFNYALDLKGNQ